MKSEPLKLLVGTLLLGIAMTVAALAATEEESLPNIIVLITDDQGWGRHWLQQSRQCLHPEPR